MPPLKDIEKEFPEIDPEFQRFCFSHGITSVEDFLLQDLYLLVALAEQEPSSEALKQGITRVLTILDGWHQPWLNGVELLKGVTQNMHLLSTGCDGIDQLLQGGLQQGQLTGLAGPSSSGKTQVCLSTASLTAVRNFGRVLYIDTGNSFSPKRIASKMAIFLNFSSLEAKEERLEKIMSRVICKSVFDIFTLLEILSQLDSSLKHQALIEHDRLQLLIIDSISSLITPILGGKNSHGQSLMVSTGFLLKKLATEHSASVLVTNHTVGGEGGVPKPALGESWKNIPHVRLFLSHDKENDSFIASILKHTMTASGQFAKFVIHDV